MTATGTTSIPGSRMGHLQTHKHTGILIEDGIIQVVSPAVNQSRQEVDHVIDAGGRMAIPGFVDPHTHAVFSGHREQEFLARVRGEPYTGGGILTTAEAVSACSQQELVDGGRRFVHRMMERGTTTLEIKSGYGLSVDAELKQLRAIDTLRTSESVRIVPTFLGAHAFPPAQSRLAYIRSIIDQMLPAIAAEKLAVYCDVFCDQGFYTVDETRTILRAATAVGLRSKLHADELADTEGAALAAELGATSADHLIRANKAGLLRMRDAAVIPVLLPGTSFTLNTDYAPARQMIALDLPVALATDFNPGTSLMYAMPTVISLAVMRLGLSAPQALTAATLNAAAALDLAALIGTIEQGKAGDLLLLDIDSIDQIPYYFDHNPVDTVVVGGRVVYDR
ncbi:imidazolonepropionase [Candidatus Bipolaricaulota bacterium]|nr:imidazolonepropionase [Candidatus Bipolaricaulota bacterium]